MRNRLVLIVLLPILGLFNYAIYGKETLRNNGELILLELAPVDPRSLMQGDYMRLQFKVAEVASRQLRELRSEAGNPSEAEAAEQAKNVVLSIGTGGTAKFVRFHRPGETLAADERLLAVQIRKNSSSRPVLIQPDSFFFQEGHADDYAQARYGRVRINGSGEHILVGLANAVGLEIEPQP
ncbi:GDYXXLXY domain-containing protein [uncultured Cohaesibacter sp.]|uniref:GDYXXLXY domain-containing protein n=1 Tax=uncultured Cohaesibacter sp. TaxID=1002546 RepID=UPI0029C884FA|nr:GDYXXLXY domain-containing protein [uncultured Cohaesibacter sp.]